jgi:hypothetical protein
MFMRHRRPPLIDKFALKLSMPVTKPSRRGSAPN